MCVYSEYNLMKSLYNKTVSIGCSILQMVYWRLVRVSEDVRWRDKDEDSPLYQEDWSR